MRRSRRGHLSGLFYNTGDFENRTVGESLGFTREFTDRISQEMLDEERIELQHRREEEERRRMNEYPYCNLDERPANYRRPLEDTPPEIL